MGSEGDEGPIPVSDLIIAAHASLLLFSLGCPSRISLEKGQFSQIDLAEAAVAAVTSPEALVESATIRAALPGGKWWLLVRVLKAYLALQSSIGIFLYDNLLSILEAIRIMQLQDAVARAHTPGEVQAQHMKAIESKFDVDITPVTGIRCPSLNGHELEQEREKIGGKSSISPF